MKPNPNAAQKAAAERADGQRQLIVAWAVGMGATALCVVLIAMPQALALAASIKIGLALAGIGVLLAGVFAASEIDRRVGSFECPACRHHFTPARGAYLKAIHGLTSRRLVCPACGKRGRCAHRLTQGSDSAGKSE